MSISIPHRRDILFLRFAVLTLCVIGTTKIERDSFVWAQTAAQVRSPVPVKMVQTPVLDDVSLSYYLPNPKILLQEDVD